jgi:hypothetical protein
LINRRLNNDQALTAQEGDLRSQRASKFTEQLLTLRQQGFENQATAETLNLKGQQQQADLAQKGIENRQRQQTINETIRAQPVASGPDHSREDRASRPAASDALEP